jgi:hypothetical protein
MKVLTSKTRLSAAVIGIATLTGMGMVIDQQTRQDRPVPMGISGGNINDMDGFYCCGGTLGSLVEDASGNQYILSNNHVMARGNRASIGDDIVQPGLLDVGCSSIPGDAVADLSAFETISFNQNNTVDGAIALVRSGMVDPTGYIHSIGTPSSETVSASVGMSVQKSGRTTGHTTGSVSTLDATVNVAYPTKCGGRRTKTGTFINTFFVTPGTFSDGGDSGSLILETGSNPRATGLLFAGSSSYTIANPIDQVLNAFNVTMVGGSGPPPDTGSISGFVLDASNSVGIGGASISVDSGQSAMSNGDGSYSISGVPTGNRTVTASAAGFNGDSTPASVSTGANTVVNFDLVSIPGGGGVKAECITYDTTGGKGGNKNLQVTVDVVDDNGLPVAGASVTVSLNRDGSPAGSGTADTNTNGSVTFQLRNAADGCYETVVDNIVATGLSYNATYPTNGFAKGTDATPDSDCIGSGDACGGGAFSGNGFGGPNFTGLQQVIRIKRRHETVIMAYPEVIAIGVGHDDVLGGVIQIFLKNDTPHQVDALPSDIEGIPVQYIWTEEFSASW